MDIKDDKSVIFQDNLLINSKKNNNVVLNEADKKRIIR